MGTSIWVIGNFIKKMDMEKKPGLMEILMKENLKTVKPMEKERIHGQMVIFTQVFLEKGDKHGQGTYTFIDGRKWVGEFRNEKIWNAKLYDKDGNVIEEFVKGVKTQE